MLRQFPARRLTVALLMISWFIATNHCALGLMKPTAQAIGVHSHCHGGSEGPGKSAPVEGMRDCCKSIHAAPLPVNVDVKLDLTESELQFFAMIQQLGADSSERAHTWSIFDHGPPRALSFAESVLQRSLFGHAPPFAV